MRALIGMFVCVYARAHFCVCVHTELCHNSQPGIRYVYVCVCACVRARVYACVCTLNYALTVNQGLGTYVCMCACAHLTVCVHTEVCFKCQLGIMYMCECVGAHARARL